MSDNKIAVTGIICALDSMVEERGVDGAAQWIEEFMVENEPSPKSRKFLILLINRLRA